MKRSLSLLGSAWTAFLVLACGGDVTGADGASVQSSLGRGSFGSDSVSAARAGNGYIVELAPGGDAELDAWLAAHHGRARAFRFSHARAVDLASPGDVAGLRALPGILGVYPNRVVQAIAKPGGGGGGPVGEVLPAGVARVGADQAWSVTTGAGVGIAIVDTGIDADHADLAHPDPAACFTAFGTCDDGHGHGTHVSGIAAALDNTTGVVGVAPGAVPYAVRVLDNSGSGTDETIIAGLEWILANAALVAPPIKVANLSLGRPGFAEDNNVLHTTVQNVVAAGITIVVAAGNDKLTEITDQVPAAYPEVLAIASTTAVAGKGLTRGSCAGISVPADTASYFTTDGAGVAVSAPGEEAENITNGCMLQSVGILSLAVGGGTTRMSGTSMASPTVAGVAALLLAQDSTRTPGDVACRLAASASSIDSAPKDSPTSSYTFDGEREGVANAPAALALSACPPIAE